MMFKCHRNECPKYLDDTIQYKDERLVRNARGIIVGQPMSTSHKLIAGKKNCIYSGPKLISNLDCNLSDCDTVTTFKI